MNRSMSLRRAVFQAVRFAGAAWRRAPSGLVMLTMGLLVPALIGRTTMGAGEAAAILIGQMLALLLGWVELLRAAVLDGEVSDTRLVSDSLRVLASNLLCGLFLSLIALILGLVLVGVAGATGLSADGDGLTMVDAPLAAALAGGGWKNFVVLALLIASVLLLTGLWARLLPAGPASLAERRVVSLTILGRTRGWGLKPAGGAFVVLWPTVLMTAALFAANATGGWIDWVWAGVLGLIQAPLLAGYAAALWRETNLEGDRP